MMATVATALLTAEGHLDPQLRAAALDHAAGAAADPSAGQESLPEPLAAFVDKVARRAHEVGDADIESLRRAGFSDDAILEAVLATAVGAGLSRLRIGMAALSARR